MLMAVSTDWGSVFGDPCNKAYGVLRPIDFWTFIHGRVNYIYIYTYICMHMYIHSPKSPRNLMYTHQQPYQSSTLQSSLEHSLTSLLTAHPQRAAASADRLPQRKGCAAETAHPIPRALAFGGLDPIPPALVFGSKVQAVIAPAQ